MRDLHKSYDDIDCVINRMYETLLELKTNKRLLKESGDNTQRKFYLRNVDRDMRYLRNQVGHLEHLTDYMKLKIEELYP